MTEPVLSAAAMRAADRAAIDHWGVPGRVLMETAGRAAADAIADRFEVAGRRVTVLVGTGNNGGDGLVVARVLAARGARVAAVVVEGDGTPDRNANLALLRRLADDDARLTVRDASGPPLDADLVVDALLGIGATGALREPARTLCEWMGSQPAPVVALDVPSGLDATTGEAAEGTPSAALTVAFGAVKSGLLLGDGPTRAGDVETVEIGIPEAELMAHATTWRATPQWLRDTLPRRAPDAHKYSAGQVLAIVGSRRFTGAAVLATSAASRAGAGAVVAATVASVQATLDARCLEVMVDAQPETDAGTLALAARHGLHDRAAAADAVLLGCGLGRHDETARVVRDLVGTIEAPLVLDADGLAPFAGDGDAFRERSAPLVLTPHTGELRRLLGDDAFDPTDRLAAVAELAARWDAVLVWKGMPSVVGLPDGRALVGPPGEPALATAGTGDVLAGTVAGLLAQGLRPADAALLALHLGAAAARLWAAGHGASGLVASDLVDRLPSAAHGLRS